MKPPAEWSPQSLSTWWPMLLSVQEMRECERHATAICTYRDNLSVDRPCHTEEWALGYICAIRDLGIMNPRQAWFLFHVFQPQEGHGE